ncbi:hypothetical protein [Fischerella sp. PCC 9605]|uniref:hypothetical protein n=1 Tax=Fischerella sp. PCC 9605 TaxID=1173024 RepID=UPI0004AF284B|nr:hypothetical protein [Fischerella sp. PCC 9605]
MTSFYFSSLDTNGDHFTPEPQPLSLLWQARVFAIASPIFQAAEVKKNLNR